jgi:hypothetical protein
VKINSSTNLVKKTNNRQNSSTLRLSLKFKKIHTQIKMKIFKRNSSPITNSSIQMLRSFQGYPKSISSNNITNNSFQQQTIILNSSRTFSLMLLNTKALNSNSRHIFNSNGIKIMHNRCINCHNHNFSSNKSIFLSVRQ